MITKEDKILIKNLRKAKTYGARQLIKEFPNKNWSRRGWKIFCEDCKQRTPLNVFTWNKLSPVRE